MDMVVTLLVELGWCAASVLCGVVMWLTAI